MRIENEKTEENPMWGLKFAVMRSGCYRLGMQADEAAFFVYSAYRAYKAEMAPPVEKVEEV